MKDEELVKLCATLPKEQKSKLGDLAWGNRMSMSAVLRRVLEVGMPVVEVDLTAEREAKAA